MHGLGGDDAVLMPAPLAHVSGLLNAVLVPGAAGMRVVLMERWDAERGLALMEAERISYMIGPPVAVHRHHRAAHLRDGARSARMRVVSSGMMGVSPEFMASAGRALGAIVKRSYGSTEAPTVSTCTNDDPPERRRDTDGRAVGQAELRGGRPGHRPAPAGRAAVGEVWIRGPELFAGYADVLDTAAAVHRGWFRSGDLGVMDGEGWLVVTGRLKELIIRGGENIASAEVERALELHPEVAQAVVVGRAGRAAGRAGGGVRGGPRGDRRRRVPSLVRRARGGPVQDPRGGGPGGRAPAAGGGEAGPCGAEGAGGRAGGGAVTGRAPVAGQGGGAAWTSR